MNDIQAHTPETLPPRWVQALGVGLLCFHGTLLAWLGWYYSPTQDEIAHLPAGLAVWELGRTDVYCVNPPLVKAWAALPVLAADHQSPWNALATVRTGRPEWRLGREFVRLNGRQSWWLVTLARWAVLPFSLLGGWVCWKWGTELRGYQEGLISLVLWCTSPSVLGYGSLITPDVPSLSCLLLAAYCYAHWWQCPGWPSCFPAGLSLGISLLTKTQWLLLIPCWIAGAFLNRGTQPCKIWCGQMAYILFLAWNVLCLGYGFQGVGERLGDVPFYSRTFTGTGHNPEQDQPTELKYSFLHALPSPVPVDFLRGIDLQMADFENGRPCYFLGTWRPRGHWAYYLVGLLLKEPLGLWLMLLTCVFRWQGATAWKQLLPLWAIVLPGVWVVLIASWQTGLHCYIRYAFPILPGLFLIAGAALRGTAVPGRWRAVLMWSCLGLYVIESLSAFPHQLSFCSRVVGGPAAGHHYFLDANVDWGQDLRLVENWIAAHPEARPIRLAWRGLYDLPEVIPHLDTAIPYPLQPGWYVVSTHTMYADTLAMAALREIEPQATLGGSHVVIEVPLSP